MKFISEKSYPPYIDEDLSSGSLDLLLILNGSAEIEEEWPRFWSDTRILIKPYFKYKGIIFEMLDTLKKNLLLFITFN